MNRNSSITARVTAGSLLLISALFSAGILLVGATGPTTPTVDTAAVPANSSGALVRDLNAGGHSVTNAATLSATNVVAQALSGSATNQFDAAGAATNAYAAATNSAAANYVALSGNQTVAGTKTFSSPPVLGSIKTPGGTYTLTLPATQNDTLLGLGGSTSITGALGAEGGGIWRLDPTTGAFICAVGNFEVDPSGDTIAGGNLQALSLLSGYGNQIVDSGGNIYFGSNSGLALDNQGQVWWSNWNYTPTVALDNNNQYHFGDGGQMTTYNEVIYADLGTIVLGDGEGDGSASFEGGEVTISSNSITLPNVTIDGPDGDVFTTGIGVSSGAGGFINMNYSTLSDEDSSVSIDWGNRRVYADDGTTANIDWHNSYVEFDHGIYVPSGSANFGNTDVSIGGNLYDSASTHGTSGQVLTATGSGIRWGPMFFPSGTPASSSATGTTGTVEYDANYIYVCTATNTWKRAALSTW